MRLFRETAHQRTRPGQCCGKVVDQKEKEEAVPGLRVVRTRQGGVLVGAPLMETEQDGPIRVDDLAEVVMGGRRLWQTKQRLIPTALSGQWCCPSSSGE